MPMNPIPIQWKPCEPPLAPCAVAARGENALRLANRVLDSHDEQLGRWRGVVGENLLILLGERDELPWTDGAFYLGRDERAPALLLPTTQSVSVALDLFGRALKLQFAQAAPPFAVFADGTTVSLANARPISRAVLQIWLTESSTR